MQAGRGRAVVAGAQVLDGEAELHADAGAAAAPTTSSDRRTGGERPRRQPERDADAIGEPRLHDAASTVGAMSAVPSDDKSSANPPMRARHKQLGAGAERDRRAAIAVRLDAEERVDVEHQRPGDRVRLDDRLRRAATRVGPTGARLRARHALSAKRSRRL